MGNFAALFHPSLDNNTRVILPIQTLYTDANPAAHLCSFIVASLPMSPAFLAGNHEVHERGGRERLQTLQTATSAWERKQREKKEDEEEEYRGKETMPSRPLFLFYQSTFSFTFSPMV